MRLWLQDDYHGQRSAENLQNEGEDEGRIWEISKATTWCLSII